MNLSTTQLAELLAGIARSQQAVVDAIDKSQPGFRGTYLLPTLNVAANLRIPEVRLMDLPSRILLRSQGRTPMDQPTIEKALFEALGVGAQTLKPLSTPTPVSSPATAPLASPVAAAVAPSAPSAPGGGGDDLSSFFDS
ncbi:MAG TPA: hypothetical protein VF928_15680 [Usitatibacteraceae bacterium]